ncbi:MAG: hypothetical protein AAFX08_02075 [Pseudomonadota bacterium]
MTFAFSWFGSYLKAAMSAALVLILAIAAASMLRGAFFSAEAAAFLAVSVFVAVALVGLPPAFFASAVPELFGVRPSGFLFSLIGAAFALATLVNLTFQDIADAGLVGASREHIVDWAGATFKDVPRVELMVIGFAGASAGGALARSRRRAIKKRTR